MSDFDEDFDNIFSEEDSTTSEIRRQRAKESIDNILEKTMVGSIKSSGRSIQRLQDENQNQGQSVVLKKGGLIVKEDGTKSRSSLLALLDPDVEEYGEIELTEGKMEKIRRQMSAAYIGPITSVSMICTGSACQVKETCAYWKNNAAPLGQECIIEKQLIREWVERYMDEFNVDPGKTTEVQLVSELAEIAVYERRINGYIAIHNPMLLQENVAGVDPTGSAFYNLDVSKAFEVKERLKKQRMKILDAMLATRDRKAKLVVSAANASSSLKELSSLNKKISELTKRKREGITIDSDE